MAVIRDVMPAFDLLQPTSAADAQRLLADIGEGAWIMAGGLDSFDWLKDRIKKPQVLVDLSGIDELRGVRVTGSGLEIGPMTTLTEIANHPEIKKNYGVLAEAVSVVASPQIRNQGTLGGNVSQDVRCWYYRGGWPCYRAGGNVCYADTPVGRNREHAIFGGNRCMAVHPSDSVPALIALDAKFVVKGSKGDQVVDAEDYFIGPEYDITRINILKPGDLLTAIRIPSTYAGAKFYFEKVRDRNVWDFPLMNVASAIKLSGNNIDDIRIAVNAVSPRPMRLKNVEDAVRGKAATSETGEMAGKLAVEGAVPLQFNAYKIPLMRNLVKRAIGGVQEGNVDFITWATSPWGRTVPTHIAWVLIWIAAIAGFFFIVVHSLYVAIVSPKKFAAEVTPAEAAGVPERVPRHSLTARLFHWIMALSMFALLITAFLPKVGVRFDWVLYHWIAGLFLTASILFHIVHATFFMDFWSIWPDRIDIRDSMRRVLRFFGKPAPPAERFAKYPLENKLYHGVVMLAGLAVTITGVFMMKRVDSIFKPRNPYLFSDMTWGMMYVLHGLAGVGFIALILVHVYMGIRPEKLPITKSMIFGWMSRDFYLEEHDPKRWAVDTTTAKKRNLASSDAD